MIDWLTFRVWTLPHDPMANGAVVKLSPGGEVEWTSTIRMEMAGSYESSMYVRSLDSCSLEISGNPAKYFQGHNLWGSDDVHALCWSLAHEVQRHFGVQVRALEVLTRADLTAMVDLGSPELVREMVRALGAASTMRNRGKARQYDEGTVYWGMGSRRWSLKAYDKGAEVLSTRGEETPEAVKSIAPGKLRLELTLRGLELKRQGLREPHKWSTLDPMKTLREFIANLELPDQAPRLDVSKLPRHLQLPFFQWAQGDDLRNLYPRPTFYRYRKQLLALGVDVAVPPAETMERVEEKQFIGFKHLPDIRQLDFWTPSEADRAALPTFVPAAPPRAVQA